MDIATARSLSALTTDFYRRTAPSFSATRQTPWAGWDVVLATAGIAAGVAVAVLDLACGNLRFERYLAGRGLAVRAWAVDGNEGLLREGSADLAASAPACETHLQTLDVMARLYLGEDLGHVLDAPRCDLAVSFGFLHHVPLREHRRAIVRALVDHVRPGGVVVVSLWQFARDPWLLSKAIPVEGGDDGDYLLGWQQERDVWRYCHSFTEAEVDELAACGAGVRELARFSADGRTGELNRYLVLRRG